ncbi:MAG TPA: hypothetical protein VM683_16135 [Anaeromyxobacteraceae bacterium]|nr:hypothetical protein [Anaeromyxobacteraceae bacterium]
MLLLEIAAQGVKGVSPSGGSARLRPGYNLVPFDGASLRRLLDALFWPSAGDAEALLVGGPGRGAQRAGVTLLGDDGATWRLVRDFAAGWQLQRLDPQRRAFTSAAREPAAVAEALAERVGVPGPAQAALLTLSAADLPSRRGVLPAVSAVSGVSGARRPLAPGEAGKRLVELRAELARAQRAEKLQGRLDVLQSRLFKLEEALREGTRLREEAASAEIALAGSAAAASVEAKLGDVEAKLAAHARAVARRDDALAKVATDRAALDEAAARGAPPAPWTDLRFWAGAGVGILALASGLALGPGHGLRYLALLDIPAFGWAAWVSLGWVQALEGRSRLGRRRQLLDDHEQKLLQAFDRESADVRAALGALGVATVAELKDALQRLADARASAEAARARVCEFEASDEARSAQEERTRVEAELREAEHALAAEAGGYVRDPRSVEMEIARVEVAATAPRGPEPAAAVAPTPATAASPARDPLEELLERAAAALGGSPTAAARAAQPRAVQIVGALSAARISGLSVEDRGNLVATVSGRATAAHALTPGDRDLVFLAVKIAFMDRALAAGKRVAVAEDAFAQLPEAARRIAGRLFKQVARPGQLLHATSDAAYREWADHVAQASP